MVRLVCWKPEIAEERASQLKAAGIPVDATPLRPHGLIAQFRDSAPPAVIIDLDRLPSQGREVAVALRTSKAMRHIPLVFAGGLAEKAEKIREELPDAVFTDWAGVSKALEYALAHPLAPEQLVQPVSHMQRYAGTSLVKKLGIKAGAEVALIGAPDDFVEQLGELPEGVRFARRAGSGTTLAIFFVRTPRELAEAVELAPDSVWIAHPKRGGRNKSSFNENHVRLAGLAAGLVDYKVCSVNADWSGLKFARKKKE